MKFLAFIIVSTQLTSAFAASCCGGVASLPALNLSDSRHQFSTSYSNNAVIYQSDQNGNLSERDINNQEVVETLGLRLTSKIGEDWQFGINIPFTNISKQSKTSQESSRGTGDITPQLTYEILPEYGYSVWKPRVFVFISQGIPTSRSTYDSRKSLRTDATSSGLYKTALGIAMAKTNGSFDWMYMGQVYQGWNRTFHQEQGDIRVEPGLGITQLIGVGYSPRGDNIRLGTGLQYQIENPTNIKGATESRSSNRYQYDSVFNLGYASKKSGSFVLSYLDQTLVGPAKNTSLSRGYSFSWVRFFD